MSGEIMPLAGARDKQVEHLVRAESLLRDALGDQQGRATSIRDDLLLAASVAIELSREFRAIAEHMEAQA